MGAMWCARESLTAHSLGNLSQLRFGACPACALSPRCLQEEEEERQREEEERRKKEEAERK